MTRADDVLGILRRVVGDRPLAFAGRCRLCGEPSRRAIYCHACSWAYGIEEYDRGSRRSLDGKTGASRSKEGS